MEVILQGIAAVMGVNYAESGAGAVVESQRLMEREGELERRLAGVADKLTAGKSELLTEYNELKSSQLDAIEEFVAKVEAGG